MSAPSGGGSPAKHSSTSFSFTPGAGWGFGILGLGLVVGLVWLICYICGVQTEVRFDYGTPTVDLVNMDPIHGRGFLDEQLIDVPSGRFSVQALQPGGISIINKAILFWVEGKDEIRVQWANHLPVTVRTNIWYRFTEDQRQLRFGAMPGDEESCRVYAKVRPADDGDWVFPDAKAIPARSQREDWNRAHGLGPSFEEFLRK